MARYRRYRRTIIRAPKKKWGSNIIDINRTITGTSDGQLFDSVTLAQNKSETSSPTPVILKTGNFKLQADLYLNPGNSTGRFHATLYIVYIPEGMEPIIYASGQQLIQNHPEWIMAWRVLENYTLTGTTSLVDSTRFTISSRLKRNLNSGDKVVALFIAEGGGISTIGYLKGKCQFWTCAN